MLYEKINVLKVPLHSEMLQKCYCNYRPLFVYKSKWQLYQARTEVTTLTTIKNFPVIIYSETYITDIRQNLTLVFLRGFNILKGFFRPARSRNSVIKWLQQIVGSSFSGHDSEKQKKKKKKITIHWGRGRAGCQIYGGGVIATW